MSVSSKTLSGQLQIHNLSGEPGMGRRFIVTCVNYAIAREYFSVYGYDPFTGTGEQRAAKQKHINKLANVNSSGDYTPTVINVCVLDSSDVQIDEGGLVTITLDKDNKLPVLDGGTRISAWEKIRGETSNPRLVDNLTLPVIVYLDPGYRKRDFVNLNSGQHINRSHLLSMQIDQGLVNQEKLDSYKQARDLCKLLHADDTSPIKDQIAFGNTTDGVYAFNVLVSTRKGDLVSSLIGSANILGAIDKGEAYYFEQFKWVKDFIDKKTVAATPGNLLALPPDGPKGCLQNLITVTNVWIYYQYIREIVGLTENSTDKLREFLEVYEVPVSGDLSAKRRQTLAGAFAQNLFKGMDEDIESPILYHHGLPTSLYVLTSGSSMCLEDPPIPSKKPKSTETAAKTTKVAATKKETDTDDAFLG